MSYTCLLMVLCECACANLISKANFNLINIPDLFICLHIMFKISFQNSKEQTIIASFWVFGQNFSLDEKSNLQIPSNLLQRFGTAAVCIVLLIFISGLYDFTLHLQLELGAYTACWIYMQS